MTETRGRITKAEKGERVKFVNTFVKPKVNPECEHDMSAQPDNTHGTCKCCGRGAATVGCDKRGRLVCRDCDDGGGVIPKHVSFIREVAVTPEVGTCMFCSDPAATLVFDTGEHICARCAE